MYPLAGIYIKIKQPLMRPRKLPKNVSKNISGLRRSAKILKKSKMTMILIKVRKSILISAKLEKKHIGYICVRWNSYKNLNLWTLRKFKLKKCRRSQEFQILGGKKSLKLKTKRLYYQC